MRDHISFEEFETFIYAEKLTPEIMMLGSRINAHVLSCSEFYIHVYDRLA